MAEIELLIAETMTGLLVAAYPWTALSWNTPLRDDSGACTTTIQMPSTARDRDELRRLSVPWRYSLVCAEGSRVHWAGPITSRVPSDDRAQMQISAKGLWQLFNAWWLSGDYAVTSLADQAADVTINAASLRGVAAEIVRIALGRPGGGLPLSVPDRDPGGDHTRTYYGYKKKTVGSALSDLTDVINGPDIRFDADYTADRLGIRWIMRVGDPLLTQPGADVGWHSQSDAVRAVGWTEDPSKLATTAWVSGDGMDRDMKSARADNPDLLAAGYPPRDVFDDNHTSGTTDQDTLDGYAQQDADDGSAPLTNLPITVSLDSGPALGSYGPGDYATITVVDDRWIPDGDYRHRILDVAVDAAARTAKLTLDDRQDAA